MSDPTGSDFDVFADAAEASLLRMSGEIRALRETVEQLQVQVRSVPATLPGPPGQPGADGGRGETGPPGPAGPAGGTGPTGPTGERGVEGIQGREGLPGRSGTDGAPGPEGRASIVPGPAGPAGPAGEGIVGSVGPAGERGADGVASVEEIRAIVLREMTELQTRTLADAYRDTYKPGQQYHRGDLVTWDGSPWLALGDTGAQPGTVPEWKQFVRKPRDGRDRK